MNTYSELVSRMVLRTCAKGPRGSSAILGKSFGSLSGLSEEPRTSSQMGLGGSHGRSVVPRRSSVSLRWTSEVLRGRSHVPRRSSGTPQRGFEDPQGASDGPRRSRGGAQRGLGDPQADSEEPRRSSTRSAGVLRRILKDPRGVLWAGLGLSGPFTEAL